MAPEQTLQQQARLTPPRRLFDRGDLLQSGVIGRHGLPIAVADPIETKVGRGHVQKARRVSGIQPVPLLDHPYEHVLTYVHGFILVFEEVPAAPRTIGP